MPDASRLNDFRRHAEWALAAATAQEVGLFERLAAGAATAEEVARSGGMSRRGVAILLGTLEGLGLVESEDGRFRLTGAGRDAFVDRGSGAFLGDAVSHWHRNVRAWALHLGEAVRTGRPWREPEAPGTEGTSDPEWLARFMAAMDSKPASQVEAVVEACLARVPRASTMLDLGGGPGTFLRGFARRGLTATLFDRPEVVDYVAEAYGLADLPRVRLERGDFLETLPDGRFDVVLLANITHIYDAETNARLLAAAGGRVAAGGVLAVLDFVRGASPFAPLFALTMLMNTERGDTYALEDYRRWMEGAGLQEVRCVDVDADRQLITARRAEAPAAENPTEDE